jgi:hypothetical protein
VNRATPPPIFREVAFASSRPTEARCNERSHTPRCRRVAFPHPNSVSCSSSDSLLCAGLKAKPPRISEPSSGIRTLTFVFSESSHRLSCASATLFRAVNGTVNWRSQRVQTPDAAVVPNHLRTRRLRFSFAYSAGCSKQVWQQLARTTRQSGRSLKARNAFDVAIL